MRVVYVVLMLFLSSALFAKGDLIVFDIPNANRSISASDVQRAFVKNGFGVVVDSEMVGAFVKQFEKSEYEIFTLLGVFHESISEELVTKHAEFGVFTPVGVGIYQAKGEDTLHLSMLSGDALRKISGVDDALVDELSSKMQASVTFVGAKKRYASEPIAVEEPLITRYEADGEMELDDLIFLLNGGFSVNGFVSPASFDLGDRVDGFDFYKTISVCKLPVIYTVALSNPEASAFAPCALAIYKKSGEDKIVLQFPSVYNWIASAAISSDEAISVLHTAQEQFEEILGEVGEASE